MKVVFPDTNVFLHYKPLSEIDWTGLCGSDSVRLVLCLAVIDELDEKKYDSRHGQRADKALKSIERWAGGEEVRPGVTMVLFSPAALAAGQGSAGDRLIQQQVCQYRDLHPDLDVAVATGDRGMKVRCASAGIATLALDDDTRRPLPKDPTQAKYTKALARVRTLEDRLPELMVLAKPVGSGEESGRDVAVGLGSLASPASPDELVRQARTAHPKTGSGLPGKALLMSGPSIESLKNYDAELDAYYAEVAVYAERLGVWQARMARSLGLDLTLSNVGSGVAKDVDVVIAQPPWSECVALDGEHVSGAGDIGRFSPPPKPSAPKRPKSLAERFQGIEGYGHLMPDISIPSPVSNVSAWLDREENCIRAHIRKLKHGHEERLCTLWLRFPTVDAVKPFTLDCELTTESHPDQIRGRILVKATWLRILRARCRRRPADGSSQG